MLKKIEIQLVSQVFKEKRKQCKQENEKVTV